MMPQLSFINVDVSAASSDAKENRRKIRSHVSKRNIVEKRERKQKEKDPPSLRSIQPRAHPSLPTPIASDEEDEHRPKTVLKRLSRGKEREPSAAGRLVTQRFLQRRNPGGAGTISRVPNTPEQQRLKRLLSTSESSTPFHLASGPPY